MPSPLLIVGLGNPGADYAGTRHNAGFMLADIIAEGWAFSEAKQKFHGQLREGVIVGQKCLLLTPATFMNRSGISVGEAAAFYKIPPERILVCYDELDLPLGRAKVKQGGGSGGHNGIRDIDRILGKDYWRLRLGIDHPGDKSRVTSYVLSRFTAEEQDALSPVLEVCSRVLPAFVEGGGKAFQEAVHGAFGKSAKEKE